MTAAWKVWIDGASRGNPGEAAYAVVIERPNLPDYEEADRLGVTTNNIAEYTALLRALERIGELGGKRLDVFSDSELLVKQMNGDYRVKNVELKALHAQVTKLAEHFDHVNLTHVRREQNARADALCNAALDGNPIPAHAASANPAERSRVVTDSVIPETKEQILRCLRQAAEAWSKNGRTNKPMPEDVWREIWTILTASALGE